MSSVHLSTRPRILELLLALGCCGCRGCDGRVNTGSLRSVHLRPVPGSRSAGSREGPRPPVSAAAATALPLPVEAHGPPASPHPRPHRSFSRRSGREAVSPCGFICFSLANNDTVSVISRAHWPLSLLKNRPCESLACLDTVLPAFLLLNCQSSECVRMLDLLPGVDLQISSRIV